MDIDLRVEYMRTRGIILYKQRSIVWEDEGNNTKKET